MSTIEMNYATGGATAPCGCGGDCGGGCGCSDPVGLERTRFFGGMLVGPDELTQDQTWLRDKLRRHNRLLHGWGVVCGCDVTQATDGQGRPVPWTVCVDQGYVLGPCGDEIVVDCPATFDIRGATGEPGPCSPPADPWCTDVRVDRRADEILYLAIRYDEQLRRPVRTVAGCGCGCDDAECEYSRIRESFALAALEALPESYRRRPTAADLQSSVTCGPAMRRAVRACPPCPTDPWVVLADVRAAADGTLEIDPIHNRRYVAAFGSYAFFCGAPVEGEHVLGDAVQKVPVSREMLADHVDAKALKALEDSGALADAATLEATSLKGVGKTSRLGRHIAGSSIADVAAVDKERFVSEAQEAGAGQAQAAELWDAARKVADIVGGQ